MDYWSIFLEAGCHSCHLVNNVTTVTPPRQQLLQSLNVCVLLQFGHSLQQLLTTVPFSEIAGQRFVEWDSLHTCANVMSMLLLHHNTLASLGRHYQTDEPLSDAMITSILKGCILCSVHFYCFMNFCMYSVLSHDQGIGLTIRGCCSTPSQFHLTTLNKLFRHICLCCQAV